MLKKKLESASVPKILIERAATRCRITIFTARPGVVIGRKGAEIDKIKEELSRLTGKEVYVEIIEVKSRSSTPNSLRTISRCNWSDGSPSDGP
jgi:small subunit ribosomal protein S3